MAAGTKSVLHPTGLVHGHSECRYLDESIPVLTQVLALDLVQRRDHEAVLKHPNTGWKLILHEGGAEVKDKPERNHYGVRVSNNEEVDRAYQYLLANKEKLGLKKVVKRKERAGSYSMFLVEPGGNYWEIESYENRHKAGLPEPIAYPWKTKLTEERLPGCGYIPQAMTHGTMECVDLEASVKFYKEALGARRHHPRSNHQTPRHQASFDALVYCESRDSGKKPQILNAAAALYRCRRITKRADGARNELQNRREEFGITAIDAIEDIVDGQAFLLSDLNRNWWEIAYMRN